MSKTPLGTSSPTARQPDFPTIYVDESLSQRIVPARLREIGLSVVTKRELFPTKRVVEDVEWLEEAGRNEWVVLTKDKRIRYRQNEIGTLVRAGVRTFVLSAGNVTGPEQAEILISAFRKMALTVSKNPGPFVFRITKAGSVERIDRQSA